MTLQSTQTEVTASYRSLMM